MMKGSNGISLAVLSLTLLVAAGCDNQGSNPGSGPRISGPRTFSSFDPPPPGDKSTPPKAIRFEQADVAQVLSLYAEISGRSIIRAGNLPDAKITFSNQTPMTPVEVLQALDTVLAANGIAMVFLGTQYAKAVPAKEAHLEPGPISELKPDQLPDSSSFVIYIVKLKNVTPSQAVAALQPFAKLPNSIVAIGSGKGSPAPSTSTLPNLPAIFGATDHPILILRDYSSNVRRMLHVLETLEER